MVSLVGLKLGTLLPQTKDLGQFSPPRLTPLVTILLCVTLKLGSFDHDQLVTLEMEPKASYVSG